MDELVDFRQYVVDSRPDHLKMHFPNGWGVSIIGGGMIGYGDGHSTFELAVVEAHTGRGWGLHYDNDVAQGGVLGYLTIEEVREAVGRVFGFDPLPLRLEGE